MKNTTNETYDIIRFIKNSKHKLILSNISEKQKDEWVNSPKTSKTDKWFDGFTSHQNKKFDCQNNKPLYPSNYTIDDLK